jgi:hypothetical protein
LNKNDASELRDYIDSLTCTAQAELLGKLWLLDKSGAGRINTSTMDERGRSLLMDEEVTKQLWATKPTEDTFLKTENDDGQDATYTCIANAGGIRRSGTVPSHQLCSGFQLTLSSRDDKEIEATSVILRKNEQGADAIARKKMRDKVVQALKPEISAGNISRILTSTDEKEYDTPSKAISWQLILKSTHRHCIQYDFVSLLTIPRNVDLLQPLQVATATNFLNAIDNWQLLQDQDYYKWQAFILKHGSKVELESNS